MNVDYNSKRVSEVIRTDAMSVQKEDFLAVHTPFRNLRYHLQGNNTDNITDEESFLIKEIVGKSDDHNLIVVKGNTGSGKSHLIRWLKEKYILEVEASNEAVLFIERQQNSLQGALMQIIDSGLFGERNTDNLKKLIQSSQFLDMEGLNLRVIHEFAQAADLAHREEETIPLERKHLRKVHDFLVDEVVRESLAIGGGAVERICNRLNPINKMERQEEAPQFTVNDFTFCTQKKRDMKRRGSSSNAVELAEDLSDRRKGEELRGKLASFLNTLLETVVENVSQLSTGDLKQIFLSLRQELRVQGRNLTIFIEDITAFSGLDRALMDVLITEHRGTEEKEKYCRLTSVVGMTEDFYQTQLRDNYRERITCLVLSNDALINHEQDVLEMSARYINAIYQPLDKLKEWLDDTDGDETKLPLIQLPSDHLWGTYQLDDRLFPLYPFNQQIILRIYDSLDNKSPRTFLRALAGMLNFYHSSATSNQGFPPPINEFVATYDIPQLQSGHEQQVLTQGGEHGNRLLTLLRGWGDGTAFSREVDGQRTVGGLVEDVFYSFSLLFITGIPKDRQPVDIPVKGNKPNLLGKNKSPKHGKETKDERTDVRDQAFQKRRSELEKWENGDKLVSFRQLRDDMLGFIVDSIDWENEGVPLVLVDAAFGNVEKLSIEGQTGRALSGYQIIRNKTNRYALEAIAAWRTLGNGSWGFPDAPNHLNNLLLWLNDSKADIIMAVSSPPDSDNNIKWEFQRWALAADFYRQAVLGNLHPIDRNALEEMPDWLYKQLFATEKLPGLNNARSKFWAQLAKNMQQIVGTEHHGLMLKLFNLVQGGYKDNIIVWFFDAATAIEILELLNKEDMAWDQFQDQPPGRNEIWYRSLSLLMDFKKRLPAAVKVEIERLQKIQEVLGQLIEQDDDEAQIDENVTGYVEFIKKMREELNESYKPEDFSLMLSGEFKAADIIKFREQLALIDQQNMVDKVLLLSEDPSILLQPILRELKNADKLLQAREEKYLQRTEDMKANNEADDLGLRLKNELDSYYSNLKGLYEGV